MTYKVKLTDNALYQLKNTIGYISDVLLAPEAAKQWSDHIKKDILSLCQLPFRYPLVDDEPWRSEKIHKMPVENFVIYYWVDDGSATVWITAVVYGRRDQISALRNMPKK